MKSRPVGIESILASDQNTRRDDARGGSFLLAHQQLGTLALGTTPTNGQVVNFIINGSTIPFTAVTGTPTNPGDVKAPGTALGFVTNLMAAARRPDLTTSTFIALSGANQQLMQYVGFAWPGSSTNIVPFSLNKNVNGANSPLTSFNITTTVTSGSWTANTMALYVEDGTYYIAGTRYLFTGGLTPTVTAPSSHPRIDVLTINTSGTLAWTTGTENASPSAPAYPAGNIPICELYNVVSETALYDTENQQSGEGYIYNDVRPALTNAHGQFVSDPGGEAQGDILFYGVSGWQLLTPGAAGTVLASNGASANPSYQSIPVGFTSGVSSYSGATGTQTIAHGLGRAPTFAEVEAFGVEIQGVSNVPIPISSIGDSSNSCVGVGISSGNEAAFTDGSNAIRLDKNGATTGYRATITTDATNLYIAWTKNGSPNPALFRWKVFG